MHDPKGDFIRFMFFLANCNDGRLQKAICDAPPPVLKPSEINTMKGIYWELVGGEYVQRTGAGAMPAFKKSEAHSWTDAVYGSAYAKMHNYDEERKTAKQARYEEECEKEKRKLADQMNRRFQQEFVSEFLKGQFWKKKF